MLQQFLLQNAVRAYKVREATRYVVASISRCDFLSICRVAETPVEIAISIFPLTFSLSPLSLPSCPLRSLFTATRAQHRQSRAIKITALRGHLREITELGLLFRDISVAENS